MPCPRQPPIMGAEPGTLCHGRIEARQPHPSWRTDWFVTLLGKQPR